MRNTIRNIVLIWIILNLLSFPLVFAEQKTTINRKIAYNPNELGNFGKTSTIDNQENPEERSQTNLKVILFSLYYIIIISALLSIKLNNKAQIQMGESIAVLMIFLILLGLGGIFMVNVLSGSVEKNREENMQLKAIDISQKVSFMPELQCSEENIVIEPCIDLLKLNATRIVVNQSLNDYYPLFDYSTIEIKQIFPTADSWVLYNRTHPTKRNQKQIQLPTSLYNATGKKYNFGWMIIDVYS